MKHDIWMPLYWADFLADTLHLGREDIGSYMLLIGAYWRRRGPLPDDNESLKQICRCKDTEWMRTKGMMATFFEVGGGIWRHKRIDSELNRAVKIATSKSESGKLGASRRWQSDGNAIGKAMAKPLATPLANGMPRQWQTDAPSQSQSPSPSKALSPLSRTVPLEPRTDKATKATKLSKAEKQTAEEFEAALASQWVNDAGKWINRIRHDLAKSNRVCDEVLNAMAERRIKTTPAAYAEQIWKEFA